MNTLLTDLLRLAEDVATHRSSLFHTAAGELISEARKICIRAHIHLPKLGRYEENSASWKPYEKFKGGRWHYPVRDHETDTWSYPILKEKKK